ncbi:acyl carrier protein [Shewanella sp. WXL01]|uniref:Acyl carrier protein n=2 Tax=Shewanellaceae TaxID=267890 RepID=A0A411PMP0_9GAMM|nr:acyl carrier protein [Shewanella maritima]NKF49971.1 acyl carrier protein [Shewanella sp. WXL01]QBF84785.1 acyl carrier protein [Shewanella maritima]
MVELFELEPEEVTAEANLFEDLDLDSIDAVDLVVFLQNKTDTNFEAEMFKSVRTVQDVVDAVVKLEAESSEIA